MAGRSWVTSAPAAIFTFLITGLVGVGGLWAGWTTSENRAFNLVLGAFMLSIALMMVLGLRRSRTTWRCVELNGQLAWAMQIGESGQAVAGALVLTTLGSGFAAWAVLGGSLGAAVVGGSLATFLLVLGLEFWALVIRRPELRISPDLLQLHGPGIDSELSWDDVGVVDQAHLGTRWGALVITTVNDSGSFRYRLRRLLLPMDRAPDPPGIHLRFGQIPDEAQLRRILRDFHVGGRPIREALISRGLPEASGY